MSTCSASLVGVEGCGGVWGVECRVDGSYCICRRKMVLLMPMGIAAFCHPLWPVSLDRAFKISGYLWGNLPTLWASNCKVQTKPSRSFTPCALKLSNAGCFTKSARTLKAMALGKPLVNPKWVDDCKQLNRLVKVCTVVKCLIAHVH